MVISRFDFRKLFLGYLAAGTILLFGSLSVQAESSSPVTNPVSLEDESFIVSKINITGNLNVSKSAIEYYLDFEVGDRVTSIMLNKSLKKIRSLPAIKDIQFTQQDGVLNVQISESPIIRSIELVNFGKNAANIREGMSLNEGDYFSPSTLRVAVKEILYAHNTMGFYLVTVDVDVEELENNQVNLRMHLNKGKRANIKRVVFSGVRAFSQDVLNEVALSAKGEKYYWILSKPAFYREDTAIYDEYNLRKFYQDNGYPDAEVSSMFSEYDVRTNSIILTFVINEGDKYRLGNSQVQSNDPQLQEKLEKQLTLRPGTTYNKAKILAVASSMEEILANAGLLFASVTPEETKREDENIIDLKYQINTKGAKGRIGKIVITGNQSLKDSYIRSKLPVKEGDVLTRKSFNSVYRALGRMQSRGYLASHNVFLGKGKNQQDGVLNISLEEAKHFSISAGGSVDTEGIKFDLSFRKLALTGTGRDFALQAYAKGKNDIAFTTSYSDEMLISRANLSAYVTYQRRGLKKLYPTFFFADSKEEVKTGNDLTAGISIVASAGENVAHSLGVVTGIRGSWLSSKIEFDPQKTDQLTIPIGFGMGEKFELTFKYGLNFDFSFYANLIHYNLAVDVSSSLSLRDDFAFKELQMSPQWVAPQKWGWDTKVGVSSSVSFILTEQVYIKSNFEAGFILPGGCFLGGLCTVSQNRRYVLGDMTFPGFAKNGLGPRRRAWREKASTNELKEAAFTYGGNYYYLYKNSMHFPLIKALAVRGNIFVVAGGVSANDIHANNEQADSSLYPHYMPRLSLGFGLEWSSPFGYLTVNFAHALVKGPTDWPKAISFTIGTGGRVGN